MINFIAKHFVKDYKNYKDPVVRRRYGVVGSVFGLVTNLMLFLVKIVIGFLFGSMSIISDAINNLSDFGNSFVSLFGFKMSQKPADKSHPFGHARMEYICSLLIAFVIIALGVVMAVESIHTIIDNKNLKFNNNTMLITICLLLFSIAVKIVQSLLYYGFGKKIDSITLKGVGADSRNDVIATFGVLVGIVISYVTNYNIDGYIAVIVAVIVIVSGIKLCKDTGNILLGEKPDKDLVKKFVTLVKGCPGVLGLHDLEMHCYGANVVHASVHVEVDAAVNVMVTHDMIDNIEKLVFDSLGIKTVIHMDPIMLNDPDTDNYRRVVAVCLKKIDPDLTMHDFRIVKGPTHINLVFDVVLTENLRGKAHEVDNQLKVMVNEKIPNSYLVVEYDEKFTDIVD